MPPDPRHGERAAVRPFAALRDSLRSGYSAADARADLAAGLVVGVVALPLSMALAIASGAPPQHGLYTAIVAGALTALLGGSRVQVSGPTAAFVVILAPISAQFGLGGLMTATMLAGAMLVAMGVARMGKLIEYIPYPVTIGFTAGIAVVIATLQVKDLLGLEVVGAPEHFLERVAAIASALDTARAPDLLIGAGTLAILLLFPRVTRRVPAPLVALTAAALAAAALEHFFPGFDAATIADRFSYVANGETRAGIPQLPPLFSPPWEGAGPDGGPLQLSWSLVEKLLPSAFAIAMLGAIESLLSAVVADGMTGAQHDPDAELFAQGVGNLVAPFFGGIAATGAIARTATNVRSGARSPFAAVVHAIVVLAAVLALAPLLGRLPMAALAALLLVVAWNMSEARHFAHTLRTAPRSDAAVLVVCFTLTVAFDMVVAVTVGVMLAALLFMKRMAELAEVRLVEEHHQLGRKLPSTIVHYEIAGPLFFGAAHRATRALRITAGSSRVALLDLRSVPVMDATGLFNLRSAIERLQKSGLLVVLGGVQRQPLEVLERARMADQPGKLVVRADFDAALDAALEHAGDSRAV